jgi:uncharacterized protein
MASKLRLPSRRVTPRAGRAARVPMAAIHRFAQQVAERFRPERIILFGSYAYGRPHAESDVDVLVVMPAANEISQSVRIWQTLDPPFPLDLLVRTPHNLRRRLDDGDWFLREVVSKGKVLYEQADPAVGAQGRSRPPRCKEARRN